MAKHEMVYAVRNPETGRSAYPATTPDGHPVTAAGAVEGCDCEDCEDRRDLDMETDDSQPTSGAYYHMGSKICPKCESRVEFWSNETGDYSLLVEPGTGGNEHGC
jgi:hypothetical protein